MPFMSDITPLYDIQKTFLENFNSWDEKTVAFQVHALPGFGVMAGLKSARYGEKQGLLLIAEIRRKGHLPSRRC